MEIEGKEVLKFQVKRNITVLFKQFLIILEDLADEHDIALDKLMEKLPPEYKDFVDLADYFGEEKSEMLRKKVLTIGNDTYRNIEEIINGFDIDVKSNDENTSSITDEKKGINSFELIKALRRVGCAAQNAGLSIEDIVKLIILEKEKTGKTGEEIGNEIKKRLTTSSRI